MSSNSDPERRGSSVTRSVTILARAPERGRVKTRLAAAVGDDAALALHEALLLDVLERVGEWIASAAAAPGAGRMVLSLTGSADAVTRARRLVGPHAALEEQSPGDLGARIEEALGRRALEAGGAPSLVVGSDCPFLSDSLLDAAAAGVTQGLVHLVPAHDGGFVLMGGGRLPPGTLAGIDWGSDRVLLQTRAAIEAAGLRVALGQPESDVDHLDDLHAARPRLEAAPRLAPRTLAWLRARVLSGEGIPGGLSDGGTERPHPG